MKTSFSLAGAAVFVFLSGSAMAQAQAPADDVVLVMPQSKANHVLAYLKQGGTYVEGMGLADDFLAGANSGATYIGKIKDDQAKSAAHIAELEKAAKAKAEPAPATPAKP